MAVFDSAQVSIGGQVVIAVLDNDVAGANAIDEGSVEIMQAPGQGTASISSDGEVTYSAGANFTNGVDVFTYRVADDQGVMSNTATVQIDLQGGNNHAPSAIFDSADVDPAMTVEIHVLDNDTDPDGDALDSDTVQIHQQGTRGSAVVQNGRIFYTPHPGVSRITDTLTYSVADINGLVSNTATIQVNISDVKR
ncbi:MAG: hypothetical protein CMJ86_04675 [Planctomycetes bacterium]|jgi:hypothetical protein|nr:hypothetical protein [Planctomycetota bacterium]